MIAIAAENGTLIKRFRLSPEATPGTAKDKVFGFHSTFGFISEDASRERENSRRRHGLANRGEWRCRFRLGALSNSGFAPAEIEGCRIEKSGDAWRMTTEFGKFLISETAEHPVARLGRGDAAVDGRAKTFRRIVAALALLVLALIFFLPRGNEAPAVPEIIEQVAVKIVPEIQKAVTVPMNALPVPKELEKKIQDRQARRAIEQNLGFLGILGRKDLKKALGGMPTQLKDASPGAGAGGKEGSGGELLVGLGEAVKRTTVGNSGVAGLGGIGTKGAGGGAGGYGNSMVGSGEGKGLSSMPLSQDVILEGGLDKAVIQATIAKYLSQVRACYENGLRKVPGLTGQVTMGFEIGGAGGVDFSRVARSTLGNAEVEGCIAKRMLTWQFPRPLGGVKVKVNYPFMLRPVTS